MLNYLEFINDTIKVTHSPPIICKESYWMYTDHGGILRVLPKILDHVEKGDKVATMHSIFGFETADYFSKNDGIVIGKSTSPINQTGGRILHLGIKAEEGFDPSNI